MIVRIAIWLLAFSLVIGQLLRLPLPGQPGGVLASDAAVVLLLVVAVGRYIFSKDQNKLLTTHHQLLTILITPFIIWSFLTLAVHWGDYAADQLAIAGAYWLRTSAYLLLLPALVYLIRDAKVYRTLCRSWLTAGSILVILGFLQLIFFPNLREVPAALLAGAGGGWDPHAGRLVSTWLDPNFFGAFSSFLILSGLAFFFSSPVRWKVLYLGLTGAASVALILTQSRSASLALALATLALSPLILLRLKVHRIPYLLPAAIGLASLALIGGLIATVVLGDRAWGLLTLDPTVRQRAESLTAIWQVAQDHPFVGVGYNVFQFVTSADQSSSGAPLHSRAGADNSFLTLLVTTGWPGLMLFIVPWLWLGYQLVNRWLREGQVFAITAAVSLLMLALQAQFINSFLYGHLLAAVAIVTALALPHI